MTRQVEQRVRELRERDYWEGLEVDGKKTLKTGISGLDKCGRYMTKWL
jgi:hypothetical protein